MTHEFGSIKINNKSVIQEFSSLSCDGLKEIPKENITSIYSDDYIPLGLVIFGAIIAVFSAIAQLIDIITEIVMIIAIIIGVILVLIAYSLKDEQIVIESPTIKIEESGKGAKKFHKKISPFFNM